MQLMSKTCHLPTIQTANHKEFHPKIHFYLKSFIFETKQQFSSKHSISHTRSDETSFKFSDRVNV